MLRQREFMKIIKVKMKLNKKYHCNNCKKAGTMFTLCLISINDKTTILCPECLQIERDKGSKIKAIC
jgi:transcription elongation factor Elf1